MLTISSASSRVQVKRIGKNMAVPMIRATMVVEQRHVAMHDKRQPSVPKGAIVTTIGLIVARKSRKKLV